MRLCESIFQEGITLINKYTLSTGTYKYIKQGI